MTFATITGSITPINNDSVSPVSFSGETTWDENAILTEAQLTKPRARRFISHNGNNSVTVHRYAKNGTRDLVLLDGTDAEKLIKYAMSNPMVHFNFDFQYQLQEQDAASGRIQRHTDCYIENQPVREINNDVATIRFTINYLALDTINAATGQPVG